MSRQSDIKALREMREQLAATGSYIKISQHQLEQYKKYDHELNNSKFVFQPLPTNHEELATSNFFKQWIDKYSDPAPAKKIVSIVFTILKAVFCALLILDMFVTNTLYNDADMFEMKADFWGHLGWLTILIQLAFLAVVIFAPLVFLHDKASDIYFEQPIGFLIAAVVITFFYWMAIGSLGSNLPFLLHLVLVALHLLSGWIASVVYRIKKKHPRLNAEQKLAVAAEKQKDLQNAAANPEKEKKDRADWEAWWEKRQVEINNQMDLHMKTAKTAIKKAEELNKKVEDNDLLGPNEKHEEIIDWLIYFLEGHRADNVKEALQQFDLMQHNEKMLELEREKYNLEVQRMRQEHEDRERAMQMERMHQVRMEAEAQRSASLQSQIAYNTAAAADAAEKMRKEAASI
ncbi:MAG: hypothetical protein J6B12_00915, partial [Clostridia bacterium]|nr:hypothetical protein [Clostridia bacterium]